MYFYSLLLGGNLLLALLCALEAELQEEWDTVTANVNITWADNVAVDSAGNAVELLLVALWEFVALENAGISDILSG